MRLLLLFFFILFCSISSIAQIKPYRTELGFVSDNDAYLGIKQDRYYTNGLTIFLRQVVKESKGNATKRIWSTFAGQKIYNARSGQTVAIEDVDRPFAAYLFGGGSFHWLQPSENSIKVSVEVGTIGPTALGEEAQTLLHKTVGFYEIEGWEFQVNDEFGINATVNLHYFIFRNAQKKLDLSLPLKIDVGNTFTGLQSGILFRTGSLNPFYHSVATNSTVSTGVEKEVTDQELYFFAKPSLSYIVYDATIQGGLFQKNKGPVIFKPRPFVFSQEIGVTYSKNRWALSFALIFESKRLDRAEKSEQYGSAQVYYRF